MKQTLVFLSGVLCLWVLYSLPIFAQQKDSEAELSLLKQKIQAIQNQMEIERNNESVVTKQLTVLEKEIASLNRDQREIKKSLVEIQSKKASLDDELHDLAQQNEQTLESVYAILRSSYMLGRQGGIKLFFSQESPSEVAQSLTFYRRLIEYKKRYLEEINARQTKINRITEALHRRKNETQSLLVDVEKNQRSLKDKEDDRRRYLERIRENLTTNAVAVDAYHKREAEILRLLRHLADNESQNQEEPKNPINLVAPKKHFSLRKGQLELPLSASIKHRFGKKRKESGLVWDGLMFGAQKGQPVRAIYAAQVVYADWFRGYGQLVILDHGEGFMSLYGHNRLLHVALGDRVNEGQLIADVGSTGGLITPGLYFEIRQNGVPVDPLIWCQ